LSTVSPEGNGLTFCQVCRLLKSCRRLTLHASRRFLSRHEASCVKEVFVVPLSRHCVLGSGCGPPRLTVSNCRLLNPFSRLVVFVSVYFESRCSLLAFRRGARTAVLFSPRSALGDVKPSFPRSPRCLGAVAHYCRELRVFCYGPPPSQVSVILVFQSVCGAPGRAVSSSHARNLATCRCA